MMSKAESESLCSLQFLRGNPARSGAHLETQGFVHQNLTGRVHQVLLPEGQGDAAGAEKFRVQASLAWRGDQSLFCKRALKKGRPLSNKKAVPVLRLREHEHCTKPDEYRSGFHCAFLEDLSMLKLVISNFGACW